MSGRKAIPIRMPLAQYELLRAFAKVEGISMNEALNRAAAFAIRRARA